MATAALLLLPALGAPIENVAERRSLLTMSNSFGCGGPPEPFPEKQPDEFCQAAGPYWGSHCKPRDDHNYCQSCTCCDGEATCSQYSDLDFSPYEPGGSKTTAGECGWWLKWYKPYTWCSGDFSCDDGRCKKAGLGETCSAGKYCATDNHPNVEIGCWKEGGLQGGEGTCTSIAEAKYRDMPCSCWFGLPFCSDSDKCGQHWCVMSTGSGEHACDLTS